MNIVVARCANDNEEKVVIRFKKVLREDTFHSKLKVKGIL